MEKAKCGNVSQGLLNHTKRVYKD